MSDRTLTKSLGMFPLIALGVSGVVGSGWIYTNGRFFDAYGAGGMIFGLAFGTIIASFIALSYARLTSLFPRAGGEVVFSYTILGRPWGFWAGWFLIGAYVSSLAFYFTAFGNLLVRVFPFMGRYPLYTVAGETVTAPVLVSGLLLTSLFVWLNYLGVSLGGQLQSVLFVSLIAIGLVIAITGFSQGSFNNFWPPFRPEQDPVSSTMRFIVPGITYMAGFGLVATLAEDAKLPVPTIGRLVVATVLLAGTFYCVVLMSSAWVLPWEDVAQMDQGTITAFEVAGFPLLSWGAYAIALLGLLTSFLGLFMATSRIVVAMARVQLLPGALSELDPQRGTPKNALLFVTLITIVLGAMGPGAIVWFLDTGGIYLGIVWVIVVASHARLVQRHPQLTKQGFSHLLLPICGSAGAALVIAYAVFPGTPNSLVWPAEYIILGVWIALGIFFHIMAPSVNEQAALQNLLGEHKAVLDTAREGAQNAD